LYTLTTVLIRLSITVFLRISAKPIHKYIIYGIMAMVLSFSVFCLFLVLFQCKLVSNFWLQYAGEGSRINLADVLDSTFAHSAVSATADSILGFLPILLIWDLQKNFRTKMSVAEIFVVGSFVSHLLH
jgi:hypothetical protein